MVAWWWLLQEEVRQRAGQEAAAPLQLVVLVLVQVLAWLVERLMSQVVGG